MLKRQTPILFATKTGLFGGKPFALSQDIVRRSSVNLLDSRSVLVRQITFFVGVGLMATAVHYVVLISAVQLFHASPVPSALLGYCCGGFVSYNLNRRHTFASDRPHGEAVWRFAIVAGVGFLLTFLFMGLLVDRWHQPYLLAQVATTGCVMFWTFAANRFWTFASDL